MLKKFFMSLFCLSLLVGCTTTETSKTNDDIKKSSEVQNKKENTKKNTKVRKNDSKEDQQSSDYKQKKTLDDEKLSDNSNVDSNKKPNKGDSNKPKPVRPESNDSNSNKPDQSKPHKHVHNWVETFKTVYHEEKGHNENVLVKEAWTEKTPQIQMEEHSICSTCGQDITGSEFVHLKSNPNCVGYYSDWQEKIVGYDVVEHPAVYETKYIVDKEAWTEKVSTGFKCSECGDKK